MKIPQKMKHLFWSVNTEKLDQITHKDYIVNQVLQFGGLSDLSWLIKHYDRDELYIMVNKNKNLSKMSVNFLKNYALKLIK